MAAGDPRKWPKQHETLPVVPTCRYLDEETVVLVGGGRADAVRGAVAFRLLSLYSILSIDIPSGMAY